MACATGIFKQAKPSTACRCLRGYRPAKDRTGAHILYIYYAQGGGKGAPGLFKQGLIANKGDL